MEGFSLMRMRSWLPAVFILVTMTSPAWAQGQPAPGGARPAGAAQTPAPIAVNAQPTFEIGLGYQYLHAGELCFDGNDNDCLGSQSFPLGFAVDGVRHFGALGLVGEVGWSRDSEDISSALFDATTSQHVFHYAAGVRWTGHNAGRVWPYAQVLAGGATLHSRVDFENDVADDAFEDSDTRTRFLVQPGVGATVVGGDGWGVFGQVDYRRLFLKEDDDGSSGRNDVRAFLGIRVILD